MEALCAITVHHALAAMLYSSQSHLRRVILHSALPAGHVGGVVGLALEALQDAHGLAGIPAAIRLRRERREGGGGEREEKEREGGEVSEGGEEDARHGDQDSKLSGVLR